MTKAVTQVAEVLDDLKTWHFKHHDAISVITEKLRSKGYTDPELADVGFLFRELAALADELRKEFKAREDLAGKLLSANVTMKNMMSGSSDDIIRGDLCSATCKMRMEGQMPKKGTDEYRRLWAALGLPEDLADAPLVKFSYDELMDEISDRVAIGKMPKGIVETWSHYWCVYRRKR